MKPLLLFLFRVIPAITFIFSGIVKAIDPVGGAIKFEDYFAAFNVDWMSPLALPLSIALSSFEFLLGFYLLLGFHVKQLAAVLLIVMSGFTVLTLYIAIFNPVSDCGCFGDAIKLTNWETFWKNVVVIIFTIGLYFTRKQYVNKVGKIRMCITATSLAVYIISLSLWGKYYQPVIDFRPFKTGTHLASQMEIPEGAEQPEIETLFIMERDGQKETFTVENYPYNDSTWIFIDTKTNIIREGFVPPLRDFHLADPDLGDQTSRIINHQGALFMMIAPDIKKIHQQAVLPLAELAELARQKDIPFYCLTASGSAATMEFDLEHKTMFRFLNADKSTLLTMSRSNPGLILLYNGVVAGKWHHRDLPEKSIIQNPLQYALSGLNKKNVILVTWVNILGLVIIPALLINFKSIKKNEKEHCRGKLENEQNTP